jgi:hypothetical protein
VEALSDYHQLPTVDAKHQHRQGHSAAHLKPEELNAAYSGHRKWHGLHPEKQSQRKIRL